ncbi:MAG: TonB-dependent receptor [Balneolaceae bacterium]|jgi:TonB-linked SusC/RagA family outer membrane protein
MKKWIPLLICLFFIALMAQGQNTRYTITGTVLDAQTEQPLPGANIQFKNLVIGTAADQDGKFELTANLKPGSYTMIISFLGFRRTERDIELGNETDVNLGTIEMDPDIIGTDEIVITGASALTSKKQLGNAISTINADELESTGASSIDRALSGKISGALIQQNSGNPAGGISVRLRGTGTLLGSADPLYIVDGVIVNNDSPQLVTLGGYSQNRLVDLNPEDIDRIEVVKGAAAAALYGSRANNGVVQIFTKKGRAGKPQITYSTKYSIGKIRKTLKVNKVPFDAAGNPVERYDFQDYIFRTAQGTNQYLSISGGQSGTRYFVSGSYFNNEGIVKGSRFQRGTGKVTLDQDLTNWASISIGANYSYAFSNEIPNGGLADNYGALTGFIFGPNTYDPRPDPVTGEYPKDGILANPVEVIDKYDVNQKVNRIIANSKLLLTPYDGLSIDYTLGLDTYNQTATFFIPVGTSAPGLGNGYARRGERANLQLNNDLNIRYQTMINEDLESTSLLGGTLQYENFSTIGIQAQDFVPFVEVVTGGSNFAQPGESRGEQSIYGVFAQETLGYQEKLFLTGAARIDAASTFGKNDRTQFYPKVSASYLVSEENFWQNSSLSDAVSSLKFRASWGQSGGLTAIGPFDRFTTFSPTSVNGRSGLIPSSSLGALDVKPERQTELELGVDASFLSDRLALEFTWYNQHTEDLLLTRSIAPTTGYLSRLGNFGTLDNEGFEILLKGAPINNRNIKWTSTLTFSRNRNKVDGIENDILVLGNSFGQSAAINGEPLGVFYSSAFARNEDGSLLLTPGGLPQREREGRDANGQPTGAIVNKVIGDPNPDFSGSFINDVQVGSHWNFHAQFDFVYGNDVFNFTRRLAALSVFGTLQDPYGRELEGDLPDGYSAAVFNIFENWVEDGSYLKLRELSASYTLLTDVLGLRSIRFSVIGRNLFSIDKYSGYDPEINTAGQSTAVRGFDFVEVPIPRTVELGISAKF